MVFDFASKYIVSQERTLTELLLSKNVTLPLLVAVIYKLYADLTNSNPSIEVVQDEPIDTKVTQKNKDPKSVELFGVEILPDEHEDWSAVEPIKYRPFKKGEYRLVMGIHNMPAEEWFLVENTYKAATDLRKRQIDNPDIKDHVILYSPDAKEETIEFYEMATNFMLRRYPQFFEVKGDLIHNKIRDEYLPVDPRSVPDAKRLNEYLNTFIEEDFIIMKPMPNEDEYVFKSGVFAFAAGFDPADKFNKPLTSIHDPVPEYKTKLQAQMNKFLSRLKVHTFVRRNNWSIQVHNKVLVMNDNKGTEDEEIKALDPETLDFEREVFFRSERQFLTRLPKTGAIVFSIRTYLTKMSDIREEIRKAELCDAIDGMQWNIGQYKRKPEWGDAVVSYLKGESNGCSKPWIKGLYEEYSS